MIYTKYLPGTMPCIGRLLPYHLQLSSLMIASQNAAAALIIETQVPLAPTLPAYIGDTSSTPRSMDGPSRRGKPSTHVSPGSEHRGRASCPGPSLRGCASLGAGCRNMLRVYGRGQRACASSAAQVSSRYAWCACIIAICVPHRDSFESGRASRDTNNTYVSQTKIWIRTYAPSIS